MRRVRVTKGADGMNKLERSYAMHLEADRFDKVIQAWKFEPLKFRLAAGCFYTPDFEVVSADGFLEYHEVKGFWRDDARVKIKVAARLFRDRRFVAVQWVKSQWVFEEIKAGGV